MPNSCTANVVIKNQKGLHVRIAAMIVQKADELQEKYSVRFKISKNTFNVVPLTSILLVTALKIKQDDEITLITEGDRVEEASEEMKLFLESDFVVDKVEMNRVDNLLQDNVITAENIFSNIENGLLVIDDKNTITIFNKEAEKLFGKSAAEVLGKKILDVFSDSKLPQIIQTKKPVIGCMDKIGQYSLIINSTPIIENDEIKGAISVVEDISKLVNITWEFTEVKELKEKYLQILEAVQDGICVYDQNGIVTYLNRAYKEMTEEDIREGSDIYALSPNGNRVKVLKDGQKIIGGISHKKNGVTVIANIVPIIVEQKILGAISIIKNISEIQELIERISQLSAKTEYLEEELSRRKKLNPAFNGIVGISSKLYDAMKMAAKTADNNYNVLIRGESGTGKELIAEAIHNSSERANYPFVKVNCAAIPENLLESEMFGHVKGAYTGAIKTQVGKFELANKGTIFLDEIGELDKSMQSKMLRVIQNKEFQRVGDEKTIKVDARIIAATNVNLEEMVKRGEFREDLYYRLNVIPIWLPSLRERKEDIPVLVEYFLEKIASELKSAPKTLSKDAMNTLVRYDWPGNIRELENLMERLVILSEDPEIQVSDLPHYICQNFVAPIGDNNAALAEDEEIQPWEVYEKRIIEKALQKYGSFNAASKALGITHKTVAAKARKYELKE